MPLTVIPEVIFFDIGGTLATPIEDGTPPSITRLMPLPWTRAMLDAAQRIGCPLGVISNTGDYPGTVITRLLHEAGIGAVFDPALLIYSKDVGVTKKSTEIFGLAARRAGHDDKRGACVYVGEDAAERQTAIAAGLQAAAPPYPAID